MICYSKFIGKTGNAGSDPFWFVQDPTILPANNAAKHGPRKRTVPRKVRGGMRAEETGMYDKFLFVHNGMGEQGIEPHSRAEQSLQNMPKIKSNHVNVCDFDLCTADGACTLGPIWGLIHDGHRTILRAMGDSFTISSPSELAV